MREIRTAVEMITILETLLWNLTNKSKNITRRGIKVAFGLRFMLNVRTKDVLIGMRKFLPQVT